MTKCAVCPRRVGGRGIYCSPACRQAAYRRRRTGARRRGLVTLVEADARVLLAQLPDASVDLVVTDPPYRFDRNGGESLGAFQTWFPDLDDSEWPAIVAELYRVLARDRHAYVFADRRVAPILTDAAAAAGFTVRHPLIWDKRSPGPGWTWRPSYELILWLEKGSRVGRLRNRRDVLAASRVFRGYPTEKPLEVLRTLVDQASRPGEVVFDPFCGSGNVGKAARDLGRVALVGDVDAAAAAARLRLAPVGLERLESLRPALRRGQLEELRAEVAA